MTIVEPEQPVDQNKTLSEEEYQQIIFDWNDTAVEYPHDRCVHQLFEAQVARTPDAIAVVFEEQQLTYNELNTKANQLAHYLKKRGVGVDVLVALCILRSIDMIVGLLGILKAGGAYVPLDPEYPTERLSFMLEDTQAPILLTQISLAKTLAGHRAEIICLDNPWGGFGYGAFEEAYRLYRHDEIKAFFHKTHNTYLENLFGLGVPVASALFLSMLGVAITALLGIIRRRRDWIYPVIGFAVTIQVAIHSLVDFSLQIPAVAITYAAIMGIATAQSYSSRKYKA